jgi:hypothetical protein
VVASCDHGNEPLGPIKGILDQKSDHRLANDSDLQS